MHWLPLAGRGTQLADGPGGRAQIEEEHRSGSSGVHDAAKHLKKGGVCTMNGMRVHRATIGDGFISESNILVAVCKVRISVIFM